MSNNKPDKDLAFIANGDNWDHRVNITDGGDISDNTADLAANLAVPEGGVDADKAMTISGVDYLGNKYRLKVNTDGEIILPNYDSVTNSNRVSDITDHAPVDILSESYTSAQYVYLDVSEYQECEVRAVWSASGADLTVATTPQNDGTAASTCSYTDRTQYGISILDGTTAASSYVNTIGFEVNVDKAKYLRLGLGQNVAFTSETITIYVNATPKR